MNDSNITIKDNTLIINENCSEYEFRDFYRHNSLNEVNNILVSPNNPRFTVKDGVLYNSDKTELFFVPRSIKELDIDPNTVYINPNAIGDINTVVVHKNLNKSLYDKGFNRCGNIGKIIVNKEFSPVNYIYRVNNFNKDATLPNVFVVNNEESFIREEKRANEFNEAGAFSESYRNIAYNEEYKKFFEKDELSIDADSYKIENGVLTFRDAEAFKSCLNPEYISSEYYGPTINYKLVIDNQKDVKKIVIPEGVEILPSGCLKDFKQLEEIVGPSVKKLGDYSLCGCSNLKKAEFSPELCSIGNRTLYRCDNLESFEPEFIINDGVLIEYRGKDENVVIPEGVTRIGVGAFEDCSFIKNVVFPDGVTEISFKSFQNCTGIESVTFPPSLKYISNNAFDSCDSLKTVTFNSEVGVGCCAFKQCDSLDRVNIVNLEAWNNSSFEDGGSNPLCYARKSLYLNGEPVTNIVIKNAELGDYVYSGCNTLTEVTFEESTKKVGDYAFEYCSNLEKAVFKGEAEVSPYAFNYCKNLKTIIVPSESMRDRLIETNAVPEGCEVKVVEKELEQSQGDELTPIDDINLAPNVELLSNKCAEIMASDEEFVYDEVDKNKETEL